jgi:hypothetical protein
MTATGGPPRSKGSVSPYQRMSISAKQAAHRERMREPSMSCPFCETQTTVADMPRHVEACTGPREPHPLSEWVGWSDALALGVPAGTLSRWVRSGRVRARGERDRREYLRRDITRLVVVRIARRPGGAL